MNKFQDSKRLVHSMISKSKFGDYAQYDLLGEHFDWIKLTVPDKKDQTPIVICENGEYCTERSFKNEWAVNFAGSKW